MQTRMIPAFAKMIEDGLCTIEDLPEKYRIPVKEYILNPPKSESPRHTPAVVTNEKLGALQIPKYEHCYIDTSDFKNIGYASASFKTNVIFSDCITQNKSLPIDPEYNLNLYEIQNAYFSIDKIEVLTSDTGFDIRIYSDSDEISQSDLPLLRVDILITSKNYEDMRFTIYIKSK